MKSVLVLPLILILCLFQVHFLVFTLRRKQSRQSETLDSPLLSPSRTVVTIIGAGAAGLSAAYTLNRHGIDYIILESSNDVGGRAKKDMNFTGGAYPLDLGASFIQFPKDIRRIIGRNDVMAVPPGKGMYKQPVFVNYSYYDFLNDYIAPKNASKIKYGCRVTSVDYTGTDIVETICEDRRMFLSQNAIVTVPLSILQDGDIEFNPPLPTSLTVDHPGTMWGGFKIIFEFEKDFVSAFCFPDIEGAQGECHESTGESFFWGVSAINERLENGNTIMMGYIMGDPVVPFLALNEDDDAIAQRVLDLIDDKYNGRARKHYVKHMVINWSKIPDIRGTYASEGYGEEGAQNVQDKIWIAGEAFPTEDSVSGYVDAGAFSGDDAAKQILKLKKGIVDETWFWKKVWKDLKVRSS